MTVERGQDFDWLHDSTQSPTGAPVQGVAQVEVYQPQASSTHFEVRVDVHGNKRTVEVDSQNGRIVSTSPPYVATANRAKSGDADVQIQVRNGDDVQMVANGSWKVLKELGVLSSGTRDSNTGAKAIDGSLQETGQERKAKQKAVSPSVGRTATNTLLRPGTRKAVAGLAAAVGMFLWLTPEGTSIGDVGDGFKTVGNSVTSGPGGWLDLTFGIGRTIKEGTP